MKFQSIALSDVGRHRRNNEDNLYFKHGWRKSNETAESYREQMAGENRRTIFAVCDGMGGEALGEQASYIVVSGLKVLEDRFNNVSGQSFPKLIDHYISRTNQTICQYIQDNDGLRMGTTLTCLLLGKHVAQVVNLGDSMAYLFRDGQAHPLSKKHTHVQRLLDMGIITHEEAAVHPERHRLTQHLGLFPEEKKLEPSVSPEIWIKENDIFMLCSDGITEMLSVSQVESMLHSGGSIEEKADRILEAALEAGGKDNATLILTQILEANPIDKGLHPEAVLDPPFELQAIRHEDEVAVKRMKQANEEETDQNNQEQSEDEDVKKGSEKAGVRRAPITTGVRHAVESVNERQANIESRAARQPSDTQIGVKSQGQHPNRQQPVQREDIPIQNLSHKRTFTLTDEDQERFRKSQQDAADRQRARKNAAAPVKVSTAYEEEQQWRALQAERKNGRASRFSWRSIVRGLIFLAVFVGIGYAAAWLIFNLASIRSFFQGFL